MVRTTLGRGRRWLFFALTAILVLVVLEVMSAVAWWIVVRPEPTADGRPAQAAALPSHLNVVSLHPYVGYVIDADATGNDGVDGFRLAPLHKRSPDRVIVAVAGGSVAQQLIESRETLEAELKKLPAYATKQFVWVELAVGGWKQPQQLLALTYMLALGGEFDVFINLDGFNEVALPLAENIAFNVNPYFPRQWNLLTTNVFNAETAAMNGRIAFVDGITGRFHAAVTGSVLRHSFTASLLEHLLHRAGDIRAAIWREAAHKRRQGQAGLTFAQRGPAYSAPSTDRTYEDLAAMWTNSSIGLANLSRSYGIEYFHFLQPNQYLPGSKTMGDKERAIAYRDDHEYRVGVVQGYPALRRSGDELRRKGVRFYDLTQLFITHDEPIYEDDCCHFNERGMELLTAAIGRTIVAALAGNARTDRR